MIVDTHGPLPVNHLLGVRQDVLDDLRRRDVRTRVYVPYSANWFRYWLRRVVESHGASHSRGLDGNLRGELTDSRTIVRLCCADGPTALDPSHGAAIRQRRR